MAHLHLPEQHSTADLVLAGQVAEAFDVGDLYVVWTEESGANATPTVQAVVREAPPNPIVAAFALFVEAVVEVWHAMTRPGAARNAAPAREQRQAA